MLRRIFVATLRFDKSNFIKEVRKNVLSTEYFRISSTPSSLFPSITRFFNIGFNPLLSGPLPVAGSNMTASGVTESSATLLPAGEELSIPVESKSEDLDEWFAADDDREQLEALKESYSAARQESDSKWLDFNKTCHIYLYRGGGEPSNSMAAFDLDGTIIKPKSNKRIPKSATDWQFFSVWTKVKIQQALRENQARFVIFTNQNGVGLGIVSLEEVQERIELVTKRLNIPCTVFVAIDKNEFRKPNVGMFNLFRWSFNASKSVDKEQSFYCGDAVGYPSHSDADIKFAQTLRLPFLPPEKFLRGVKPKLVETK